MKIESEGESAVHRSKVRGILACVAACFAAVVLCAIAGADIACMEPFDIVRATADFVVILWAVAITVWRLTC